MKIIIESGVNRNWVNVYLLHGKNVGRKIGQVHNLNKPRHGWGGASQASYYFYPEADLLEAGLPHLGGAEHFSHKEIKERIQEEVNRAEKTGVFG
jgi:hypothetical protein